MDKVPNPTDTPTAVDIHDRLIEITEKLVRTADATAASLRNAPPPPSRFDWEIVSYAAALAVLVVAFGILGALVGVR